MEECKNLEASAWEVLIVGDINVAPDARDGHPELRTPPQQHVINRADFLKTFLERSHGAEDGLNSVDIWRKMHGDERRYTYYSKGREWGTNCDRVDYVIVGRGLGGKGLVKACGILGSEEERGLAITFRYGWTLASGKEYI
jgi:exonuclease III